MERIKKVEDKYKRYPPSLAPETPQFLSTKPFSNQVELNIQICPTCRFPRRPHCAVNSNSYLDTLITTIKNEEKTPLVLSQPHHFSCAQNSVVLPLIYIHHLPQWRKRERFFISSRWTYCKLCFANFKIELNLGGQGWNQIVNPDWHSLQHKLELHCTKRDNSAPISLVLSHLCIMTVENTNSHSLNLLHPIKKKRIGQSRHTLEIIQRNQLHIKGKFIW